MPTNDLIYIREIKVKLFDPYVDATGKTISAQDQWNAFNAFIEQDDYLKIIVVKLQIVWSNQSWFSNMDLRLLQDFSFFMGTQNIHFS